jgi:hypothetical protein
MQCVRISMASAKLRFLVVDGQEVTSIPGLTPLRKIRLLGCRLQLAWTFSACFDAVYHYVIEPQRTCLPKLALPLRLGVDTQLDQAGLCNLFVHRSTLLSTHTSCWRLLVWKTLRHPQTSHCHLHHAGYLLYHMAPLHGLDLSMVTSCMVQVLRTICGAIIYLMRSWKRQPGRHNWHDKTRKLRTCR